MATIRHDPAQDRDAVLDAAHRLVQEYGGLPAGSVLRCFARSVRDVRRLGTGSGTPVRELLPGILATTRARLDGRAGRDGGSLPAQRGPGHRSRPALSA
jgi:hypothetical protein